VASGHLRKHFQTPTVEMAARYAIGLGVGGRRGACVRRRALYLVRTLAATNSVQDAVVARTICVRGLEDSCARVRDAAADSLILVHPETLVLCCTKQAFDRDSWRSRVACHARRIGVAWKRTAKHFGLPDELTQIITDQILRCLLSVPPSVQIVEQ
jgi:hypothetical protein